MKDSQAQKKPQDVTGHTQQPQKRKEQNAKKDNNPWGSDKDASPWAPSTQNAKK